MVVAAAGVVAFSGGGVGGGSRGCGGGSDGGGGVGGGAGAGAGDGGGSSSVGGDGGSVGGSGGGAACFETCPSLWLSWLHLAKHKEPPYSPATLCTPELTAHQPPERALPQGHDFLFVGCHRANNRVDSM